MTQAFNGLGLNPGNAFNCYWEMPFRKHCKITLENIGFEAMTIYYQANTRFSLYRWHIMDPVRFKQDLGVTMQSLGWRAGGRYLPSQDDMASTAFWYQTEPHAAFPALPDRDGLEIV